MLFRNERNFFSKQMWPQRRTGRIRDSWTRSTGRTAIRRAPAPANHRSTSIRTRPRRCTHSPSTWATTTPPKRCCTSSTTATAVSNITWLYLVLLVRGVRYQGRVQNFYRVFIVITVAWHSCFLLRFKVLLD